MAHPTFSEEDFTFAPPLILEDEHSRTYISYLMRGFVHKLNNLLAVMEGFSSLILMDQNQDEAVTESLQHMRDAARNASSLSKRSLTAGGCANINFQELRLDDFLTMLDTGLHEPFTRLGVDFEMKVSPNLPHITTDASRLKEIIGEVLKNAAEAASLVGGKAWMEVYEPSKAGQGHKGVVYILIHNTGSDIPPDKLAEIFRPFHSYKDTKHFGLGLAISAVLCGQIGMRIGVRSRNNTTSFLITCPVAG